MKKQKESEGGPQGGVSYPAHRRPVLRSSAQTLRDERSPQPPRHRPGECGSYRPVVRGKEAAFHISSKICDPVQNRASITGSGKRILFMKKEMAQLRSSTWVSSNMSTIRGLRQRPRLCHLGAGHVISKRMDVTFPD